MALSIVLLGIFLIMSGLMGIFAELNIPALNVIRWVIAIICGILLLLGR